MSHGAARGYSWPQAAPGNLLALRHGCYSPRVMGPRAAETAEWLRRILPVVEEADSAALEVLSYMLVQAGAAAEAAEAAGPGDRKLRLSRDARAWSVAAMKALETFGGTPASRARLGLDMVRAGREAVSLRQLASELGLDELPLEERVAAARALVDDGEPWGG